MDTLLFLSIRTIITILIIPFPHMDILITLIITRIPNLAHPILAHIIILIITVLITISIPTLLKHSNTPPLDIILVQIQPPLGDG